MKDLGNGRWELFHEDELYPPMMRELANPPKVLRGRGDPRSLTGPCVSIIGSRRPTPYGRAIAEMAGRVAAAGGVCVVSGGAMGCDSYAGRAALSAGGRHIVVPGCGADTIYPESSKDVYEGAISSGGAVISAEMWGQGPRRYAFPRRNALIAALSRDLIVTEGGPRSGTMSTADAALELGRGVYAIPGSVFSPTSKGTNSLIAEGARIIPDQESLELAISLDYGFLLLRQEAPDESLDPLMAALVADPMRPEDLAEQMGMSASAMLMELTSLEAAGVVERLCDGRYSPTAAFLMGHNGSS